MHVSVTMRGLIHCSVQAMEDGMSEAQIHEFTNIDPWFLAQLGGLHAAENWLRTQSLGSLSPDDWSQAKRRGFSDPQLAMFLGTFWAQPCLPKGTYAVSCMPQRTGCARRA